ncbi:unnamed protein product [Mytilus coruscus]|uniref:Uncharacterized protein n=1 Tax=Mytilus coruscus TaxID=42192 RepID=A0A6J7ZV33_MYTCO|nr:unnamed protein product [Mytilus coruscus]
MSSTDFDRHFYAYVVEETNECKLIKIPDLPEREKKIFKVKVVEKDPTQCQQNLPPIQKLHVQNSSQCISLQDSENHDHPFVTESSPEIYSRSENVPPAQNRALPLFRGQPLTQDGQVLSLGMQCSAQDKQLHTLSYKRQSAAGGVGSEDAALRREITRKIWPRIYNFPVSTAPRALVIKLENKEVLEKETYQDYYTQFTLMLTGMRVACKFSVQFIDLCKENIY